MANEYAGRVDVDRLDGALDEGIVQLGLDPVELPDGDYPMALDTISNEASDSDDSDDSDEVAE